MKKIGDLFGNKVKAKQKKHRRTERGDLLDYFLSKLNPQRIKDGFTPLTYGSISFFLTKIPTKDLYALRSKCDDAQARGVPWGAVFWLEIRPKGTIHTIPQDGLAKTS